MKNLIFIFSIIFFNYGCNKSVSEYPKPINFKTIYNGALYGSGVEGIKQSNRVVNNTADWQNLVTQMDSYNATSERFSETNIDFDNYLIIAVFLEVKSSGWKMQINDITEHENSVVVSTHENPPIVSISVITQPFSIVKIRRTEKNIEFN